MAEPIIIKEWNNDSTGGIAIAIVIVAVVALVIRAVTTGRIDLWNKDTKTLDVNIEAPALPTTDDMPTVDMPSTDE